MRSILKKSKIFSLTLILLRALFFILIKYLIDPNLTSKCLLLNKIWIIIGTPIKGKNHNKCGDKKPIASLRSITMNRLLKV